ncbi:hypothetical protein Tsubulata_018238 [Turnera subulata]|uniref:Myb/SANT-like domain-containing protein n=1 Tax=Turnera subulata TaxID=218843 RepID=A0A9Q0FGE0_9ROSI|nr:hypothetical protein Tsubulata_018238 [Turnera subulata]
MGTSSFVFVLLPRKQKCRKITAKFSIIQVESTEKTRVVGDKKMGAQVPQGIDQTLMTWTPMMEQYFVDLMLHQMSLGNRVGHAFNKQAWTDMLTAFNAEFRTEYGMDVLKIQHTNLWKQYIDVKNILEQHGFYWDASEKMVMASDDIWDSYIKVYPDAQCYRKKVLLNFANLCLIYSYEVADGRYSRSSHDMDMDDDIQGVNRGSKTGSFAPESVEHSKSNWSLVMDQYFVELMLDQIRKGNRSDKRFSIQAWKEMLALFNAKFSSQHGKTFLKRRYRKLLKYYADARSILQRKGFYWDEKQHKIMADDGVWDMYIKAHPDMHWFRKKTLPNYQDLSLVYESDLINGHGSLMHQENSFEDNILQGKDGDIGQEKDRLSSPGDSVEPYWTTAMDHYLIDLLQDQALRGNKIGQNLTAEAWIEIIRLFNEKFVVQYSQDIINSRYNFLRRQHNGVKVLLEQSEFSWDEIQEMVHPDALPYRNKSVSSYHKLCVIYGEESCNGGSGHRPHNLETDGQGAVFMINGEDGNCLANGPADWTLLMDRYFIDIMLEHVRRGSKISTILDNEALIDMVALFKENFRLQLDKDAIKERYRSLRKLFNDIKNLLCQRGFSWDDTRQLVRANDGVWDAYVEEHPGARTYRAKPQPNYDDLHLIYGKLASEETANLLGPAKPINSRNSTTYWTPPMDRFFIDLMLKHARQGSMVEQRLDEHAWTDMVAKFNAAFGSQHDKDVLKERFIILREQFNDMKKLVDQCGFAWDECQQMIIANNGTWDGYVKEFPDAWPYRNRTLPNYNDLFLIYGGKNRRNFPTCPDAVSEIAYPRRKRKSTPSSVVPLGKVRRHKKEQAGEDFGLSKNNVAIEVIVDALQAIPDMDDELFLESCKLLENDKIAEVFVAMDVNERRNWLFRKLWR